MTKKKPLVVVTRRLPELVETRMRELFDARLNLEDQPMSQAEIVETMREADVLVPTITDQINAAMIAQAGEQMKLIANFGNGVDHIDVTSALRRGITVTNTPGVLTEDTADMTMALILSTARRLVEGSRVIPEGRWTGWSPTWMMGRRITGKRLGIVGMGRIGQALARRARAFGMSIHYHNRRRVAGQIEESLEATYWDSLDQPPRGREDQRHRHVRRVLGQHPRRVGHDDAAMMSRGEVDVIYPGSERGDLLQRRAGGSQHLGIDSIGYRRDQNIGCANSGFQL